LSQYAPRCGCKAAGGETPPDAAGAEGVDNPSRASLLGHLPRRPVTAGSPRLLRGLTRHRDTLHDLCRGKGGRRPAAECVGQDLRDHGGECCIAPPCHCCRLERGGEGEPTLAPRAPCSTVHVHLACHLAVVGPSLHGQQDLGTPHQTLRTGLTACARLQAGPLSCRECDLGGDRDGRRNHGGHTGVLSQEFCNIQPL
jgi:hypothetical protein